MERQSPCRKPPPGRSGAARGALRQCRCLSPAAQVERPASCWPGVPMSVAGSRERPNPIRARPRSFSARGREARRSCRLALRAARGEGLRWLQGGLHAPVGAASGEKALQFLAVRAGTLARTHRGHCRECLPAALLARSNRSDGKLGDAFKNGLGGALTSAAAIFSHSAAECWSPNVCRHRKAGATRRGWSSDAAHPARRASCQASLSAAAV